VFTAQRRRRDLSVEYGWRSASRFGVVGGERGIEGVEKSITDNKPRLIFMEYLFF
jgi:hypothetical protein